VVNKLLMTVVATMIVLPTGASAAEGVQTAASTIQAANNRVQNMVSAAAAQKDQIKLQCVSEKAELLGSIAAAVETAPAAERVRMADEANRIAGEAGECVGANGKKASEDVADGQKAAEKGKATNGSVVPEAVTTQIGANSPASAPLVGSTAGETGFSVSVPPAASSAK